MNTPTSLIDEWAHAAPENLIFVSVKRIMDYLSLNICSANTRRVLVSELVARWCLSADVSVDRCLSDILDTDWDDFKDWYGIECSCGISISAPDRLWRGKYPVSVSCEGDVRRRVADLLMVDGFIPIIENGEDAAFVPFTLEPSVHSEILDAEGICISGWQGPFEEVLMGESGWRARVLCRVRHELPPFIGRSLMLPIKMAVWRRTSRIPMYNSLRVIATGAFNARGNLVPVDDDLKIIGFSKTFKQGIFFCPWSSSAADDPAFVRRIDDRDPLDDLVTILSKELESSGLARLDVKYVLDRLPVIERDVCSENYNRWQRISDRVSAMLGAIDEERYPEKRLLLLMLKCAALRHSGRTAECSGLTSVALDLAQKHGWKNEVLRLQVESLVIAQDEGDFDSVRMLGCSLTDRIIGCGDDAIPLAMRFYGTMGQAHVWGTLIDADGFLRENARECFVRALKCAFKLDDEREIARDLNYSHLWYAFFSPGSQEENDAYVRAKTHIERNLTCKKSQHANMYYLLRQRSVAFLQRWKRTGQLTDMETIKNALLPLADADGWLCASNRRCIGALLAAHGLFKEAAKAFEDGDMALPERACVGSPVLAYVRLALLVQASVSLSGHPEGPELSEDYAEKAKHLYDLMSISKLFATAHVDRWMDAMHRRDTPRKIPDVYY